MDLYTGKFGIIPLIYLSEHMMTSTQNTGTSNQINCWFWMSLKKTGVHEYHIPQKKLSEQSREQRNSTHVDPWLPVPIYIYSICEH